MDMGSIITMKMAPDLELCCILIAYVPNERTEMKMFFLSYLFSYATKLPLELDIPPCQFLHLLQHGTETSRELVHELIVIIIIVRRHDASIYGRGKGEVELETSMMRMKLLCKDCE